MRLIDADAFDTILENGEIEAKKQRKYVLASALNTVRGNLAKQSSVSSNSSEIPNGWIPCEKKLPEKSEKYEVTIKNVTTIFDGETGEVVERVGYYVDCDIYKSYLLRKWHRYDGGQVIAWRKLPEPYQPKEESGE